MDRAVNERKLYPWVSLGGKIYCPWVSRREGTGKIHIGPSALPPLYSDKIFKSSHYFALGYSAEMPGPKPQNVYIPVDTHTHGFWRIDSYIKISSSH